MCPLLGGVAPLFHVQGICTEFRNAPSVIRGGAGGVQGLQGINGRAAGGCRGCRGVQGGCKGGCGSPIQHPHAVHTLVHHINIGRGAVMALRSSAVQPVDSRNRWPGYPLFRLHNRWS